MGLQRRAHSKRNLTMGGGRSYDKLALELEARRWESWQYGR